METIQDNPPDNFSVSDSLLTLDFSLEYQYMQDNVLFGEKFVLHPSPLPCG